LIPATDTVVIGGGVIRPAHPNGDDFYGLAPGTNGTAAAMRRTLVTPEGFAWFRYDGSRPVGLLVVPLARPSPFSNPWSGL